MIEGGEGALAPERARFNRVVVAAVDGFATGLARHWLAVWNTTLGVLVGGTLAGPAAEAAGQSRLADAIYGAYQHLCHQLPYRSSYVFGHKLCVCDRCLAIYAGLLLAGIAFALVRHRLRSLSLGLFALACVPMGWDGVTQLFGYRESDTTLRVLTGLLFGIAVAWMSYPILEKSWRRSLDQMTRPERADRVD